MTYNFIDIFSGCGGMSLGFTNAGIEGIFAIEKDEWAFQTLSHNFLENRVFNWPDWLPKTALDIRSFEKDYPQEIQMLNKKVDVIVGCPPCQGFSYRGKRNFNDERNNLYQKLLSLVFKIEPRILIFENVEGITTKFNRSDLPISELIERKLENNGYKTYMDILYTSHFGVPQQRKRFFLWALHKKSFNNDLKNPFDLLRERKDSLLEKIGIEKIPISAKDAIHDLRKLNKNTYIEKGFKFGKYSDPTSNYQQFMRLKYNNNNPDSHRFPNHSSKILERFCIILKKCKKGRTISSIDKKRLGLLKRNMSVLAPNQPSMTVTSLPDDILHYSQPRILTIREIARLQSFPDQFEFKGQYTTGGKQRSYQCPRYTQVANAVPPLMAELIGSVTVELLDSR